MPSHLLNVLIILLQCFEAITVKTAVVNAFKMFKDENLDVDMIRFDS